MRISADPQDPGYQPVASTAQYQVYFNNKLETHCVTADEETGECIVHALDDAGVVIHDGFMPKKIHKTGLIKIIRTLPNGLVVDQCLTPAAMHQREPHNEP